MSKPSPRFASLEGLRGFLAIAVFLHHAELTRRLVDAGVWDNESHFFQFLGPSGVACFFMITALLFWNKVLAARKPLPFVGMLVGSWFLWIHLYRLSPVFSFLVGMVAAVALRSEWGPKVSRGLQGPMASVLALLLLCAAFAAFRDHYSLGKPSVLLLAGFFCIIASGNTLGGLLTWRPARVFGTVSYSLYLMQGIVLFIGRALIPLKGATAGTVGLFEIVCGVALTLVSLATYRWIEYPYLAPQPARQAAPAVQAAA